MIRSRWNESEIQQLADEQRRFVISQLKEAKQINNALANRMLLLILSESVLLGGLALSAGNIFGGAGWVSLIFRLAYVLGAGAASLLLIISMAIAANGAAAIWETNPVNALPATALPRQARLDQALAETTQLRQSQRRCDRLYRRAMTLLLVSLLPYALAMAVLVLQVL